MEYISYGEGIQLGNVHGFAKKIMALLWFHVGGTQEVRLKFLRIEIV